MPNVMKPVRSMVAGNIAAKLEPFPGAGGGATLSIPSSGPYGVGHSQGRGQDPIEAIRLRMVQLGINRRDLEPMIGPSSRVSEILSGKRSLTINMIRRLRDGLGISADILIGPGEL